MLIAASSTGFAVVLCAAAAFAFAKLRFRGSELVFALLLATMMVPPEVVYPGQFILFSRMGLIDTLAVQVLPTITPVLGLFLVRQVHAVDPRRTYRRGAHRRRRLFTMFWRIIVPVSSPVLGAYAILHFLSIWNAYLWPTMVATRDAVKPIMVALPELVDPTIGFLPIYGTIMAGCVAATIPLLVVFLRYRDKFMASVTVGADKVTPPTGCHNTPNDHFLDYVMVGSRPRVGRLRIGLCIGPRCLIPGFDGAFFS